MVKEFTKFISPFLSDFKKITVDFKHQQMIDNCALKHLKVDNIYKLKDIYEGASYYENLKNTSLAQVAVEKLLGIKFIDWEKKQQFKNYKPTLNISDIKIEIVACPFGELPLIKKDTLDNIIICLVADNRVVTVCGYMNLKNNEIQFLRSSHVVMKTIGRFTSFELIKPFNNLEEITSFAVVGF